MQVTASRVVCVGGGDTSIDVVSVSRRIGTLKDYKENPEDVEDGQDFTANLNPDSLKILDGCKIEPSTKDTKPLDRFQFERLGYFYADKDSCSDKLIYNRIVTLRDTWAKMAR